MALVIVILEKRLVVSADDRCEGLCLARARNANPAAACSASRAVRWPSDPSLSRTSAICGRDRARSATRGRMYLPARLRLSILLYVDGALMRERPEPKDPVVAAHAALIDATERQLVLQVMREEPVDRHAAR